MKTKLEVGIELEDKLISQCAEVWGAEKAKEQAQIHAARIEKDMRKTISCMRDTLAEVNRVFGASSGQNNK